MFRPNRFSRSAPLTAAPGCLRVLQVCWSGIRQRRHQVSRAGSCASAESERELTPPGLSFPSFAFSGFGKQI